MTKDQARAYIETLGDDEPCFVLRGKDRFMAPTIRHWARVVDAADAANTDDDLGRPMSGTRRKVIEAQELANTVDFWQRDNGSKIPD